MLSSSRVEAGDRLAALRLTALLDAPREALFDRLVEVVASALGAPVALLSLVDDRRQFFLASVGLPEALRARRETPVSHALCRHEVESDAPLVVEDARRDPRVAGSPAIDAIGIGAYAGMPVRTADGHVLGSLCAIDHNRRAWSDDELATLRRLTAITTAIIVLRTDLRRAGAAAEERVSSTVEHERSRRAGRAQREQSASDLQHLGLRLQQSLLPRLIAPARGRLVALYEPGERRMLVGGDFFDAYESPEGTLSLLIGDVSGHGPEAAAFATGLRAAWRALLLTGTRPERVLQALNLVALSERPDLELFATVCSCWIDASSRELVWLSAGHPAPVIVAGTAHQARGTIGLPLGIDPDAAWTPNHTTVPAGGNVMLFTDGLVEGRAEPGSSERFGTERLFRLLERPQAPDLSAEALHEVLALVRRAHGEPLPDDVAMLVAAVDE
jgi:serine phosphatase RsbU (regulator of sigma subunit)